ncbi:MAG: lamin tail domain-containing protein [Acidimicrobiia bacterium]
MRIVSLSRPTAVLAVLLLVSCTSSAPSQVSTTITTTTVEPSTSSNGPVSTTTTTSPVTTTTDAPGTTAVAAPTTTPTVPPPVDDPLYAPPAAGSSGDPSAALPPGAEVVTVASITDGDTLDVRFDDGSVFEVRVIGTNSPESGECFSDEAARVLTALAPPGARIGMTSDVSETDQFDRLLRYLWLGAMSINEETVRRGAAISRSYPPDTAMTDRFEEAQAEARETGLGLWSPTACGPRAEAALGIVELISDAPGNDNENLNGEWIAIQNEGAAPVDLTGWGIKDESASHRYAFPPSFTLFPRETVTVRTGCGTDFDTDLYWCNQGSAVWNNDGDTAFIVDPNGNTHVAYAYSG